MIQKINRVSDSKKDVSIEALRKRILANASYLDKDAVDFVMKKLEQGGFSADILKL